MSSSQNTTNTPTTTSKNIAIFGGNGFLGRRICETAISKGYNVTSFSSSGKKPWNASAEDQKWIDKVNWVKADVFKPESYQEYLKDADAVVHSIGVLFENVEYKQKVRSKDSIFKQIKNFLFPPATTPEAEEKAAPAEKDSKFSYARMNVESAVILGKTLIEVKEKSNDGKAPAFVYISADKKVPGTNGYIESKRQAEKEVSELGPKLRTVFMRPGFMYDEKVNDDARAKLKLLLSFLNKLNSTVLLHGFDKTIRPIISTQQVSKWCVSKIEDDKFQGPLMLDTMVGRTHSSSPIRKIIVSALFVGISSFLLLLFINSSPALKSTVEEYVKLDGILDHMHIRG
ncbi:unnamed protein product [Ambrosiozyma monospora]|uniref:Unnamed protein product n=1 Tax=Ambrosiozyma monospora TaxID=43982 RepID=A0ACB5SYN1_AMBMO|nr:unnamed protein product [Ambrosiozyma monospora]